MIEIASVAVRGPPMPNVDAHEISFQCPRCGHDLVETIGHLKANRQLVCGDCGVGINFDTDKLARATHVLEDATAALQAAAEAIPGEITIKFFR
jgi:transcription elongation factor Elf1